MKRTAIPHPVLKWAGGKSTLLPEILRRLPAKIGTYYEPFVGGAAVFFALALERRFDRAVLGDRNRELVNVYRALQHDVDSVLEQLERYAAEHSEESYYRVRAEPPRSRAARAARFIYLNKTGYNGLYRVNSSGAFNVPYGRYKQPRIIDEANLRAAAQALRGVTLQTADFADVCAEADAGDAVYFDPPYLPVSRTSSFTAYERHGFELADHQRLARVFAELGARNVVGVLSNSSTVETRELFGTWRLDIVQVARSINSQGGRRGPVDEILVVNQRAPR